MLTAYNIHQQNQKLKLSLAETAMSHILASLYSEEVCRACQKIVTQIQDRFANGLPILDDYVTVSYRDLQIGPAHRNELTGVLRQLGFTVTDTITGKLIISWADAYSKPGPVAEWP